MPSLVIHGAPMTWNPAMEEALLETLVQQRRLGFASESGFKKSAWTAACEAIQPHIVQRHKDGSLYVLRQTQASAKNSDFKALYSEWQMLRNNSGFGYEEETGLFTASEDVWASRLKVSLCV